MTVANRRTLTRGALWAAPVLLASATIPAYAASQLGTAKTTAGKYYHTVSTTTPSGCNVSTNPQYGYIDTLPYRSPAGNSNTRRDPNTSSGYWVEGTAGTVNNVTIVTTYTFNRAIQLDTSSTRWGANIIPSGWTVTQVDSSTIRVTYTATTWNVSTTVVGSGDATGFFLNFHVTAGCYPSRTVTISSTTVMTYFDANGKQTFTKNTGPTGI